MVQLFGLPPCYFPPLRHGRRSDGALRGILLLHVRSADSRFQCLFMGSSPTSTRSPTPSRSPSSIRSHTGSAVGCAGAVRNANFIWTLAAVLSCRHLCHLGASLLPPFAGWTVEAQLPRSRIHIIIAKFVFNVVFVHYYIVAGAPERSMLAWLRASHRSFPAVACCSVCRPFWTGRILMDPVGAGTDVDTRRAVASRPNMAPSITNFVFSMVFVHYYIVAGAPARSTPAWLGASHRSLSAVACCSTCRPFWTGQILMDPVGAGTAVDAEGSCSTTKYGTRGYMPPATSPVRTNPWDSTLPGGMSTRWSQGGLPQGQQQACKMLQYRGHRHHRTGFDR